MKDIHIASAALTGQIYIGRVSKRDPCLFTSKEDRTIEALKAVADYLMHGCPEGGVQDCSFDAGETWLRISAQPIDAAEVHPEPPDTEAAGGAAEAD